MNEKRILVVDDEKNIRLTLARTLASEFVEVNQVGSGEEALEQLLLYSYDLVLLDLRLPGMSGYDLLRQMKEYDISAKTVVITAHGTVELAVKLMKEGVEDVVEKPFSPEEIRQIVASHL